MLTLEKELRDGGAAEISYIPQHVVLIVGSVSNFQA
jgi:hypothetical protein